MFFFIIPIKRTKQKINNVVAKADAKTHLTCTVIHFIERYTPTLPLWTTPEIFFRNEFTEYWVAFWLSPQVIQMVIITYHYVHPACICRQLPIGELSYKLPVWIWQNPKIQRLSWLQMWWVKQTVSKENSSLILFYFLE